MPWFIWLLSSLLVVSFWTKEAESCSCMPAHPQQQYCKDDFAILVRVRREFLINERRVYVVVIKKRYKFNDKAREALKTRHLITAADSSMCGEVLEVGKVYALTGKIFGLKANFGLCNMVLEWSLLTKRQRKGLKKLYQNGCNCKINPCFSGRCKKIRTACNWVQGKAAGCFAKEGICQKTPSNQCMWTRNQELAQCKRSFYLPFLGNQDRKSVQ